MSPLSRRRTALAKMCDRVNRIGVRRDAFAAQADAASAACAVGGPSADALWINGTRRTKSITKQNLITVNKVALCSLTTNEDTTRRCASLPFLLLIVIVANPQLLPLPAEHHFW